MGVILIAFLLASSRGGFLGLVVAFAVLIWRSRRRLRNIAITSMILIPLIVTPRSPVQRMLKPTFGDRIGTIDREAEWRAGLRMIQAHPFTGIGLANFKPEMRYYADSDNETDHVAHNTYISIAAEVGIPTLLVYLSVLFFTYRSLLKSQRRAIAVRSATIYHAAVSAEASLAGSIVGIFFLTAEYQKFVWLVIFLSVVLSALLENAEQSYERLSRNPRSVKVSTSRPDRSAMPSRIPAQTFVSHAQKDRSLQSQP
jgi:putative inorganic carbon (HCO3(-)) transporter